MLVRSQVVGFKKIKFFTNENVGDGKLELARKRNAHHRVLDHARTLAAHQPCPSRSPSAKAEFSACCYALESMATLLLMCDRRDLGTAVGERPASPGVETEWQEFTTAMNDPAEMKEYLRAESVSLRRVSRRHRI